MGSWSFRVPSANLAAFALAGCLLGAAPAGTVYITTLPSGADVWVDGMYLGRSPILVGALVSGSHHVTLSRTGWTAADLSVMVTTGQTETTSVVLVRAGPAAADGGTLAIHADAKVGSVSVDGESVTLGKDGTVAVVAGTHEVTIVWAHGKTVRDVTVYPQTRTDVVLRNDDEPRSVVIAPADDYLPASAYHLDGTRLVVRYGGHDVVAHVGQTAYTIDHHATTFDAPPSVIGTRVYLPLELLTLLTANDKK